MHPIHLDKTLQIVNINHTQISTITAVSWGEKKKKKRMPINFCPLPKERAECQAEKISIQMQRVAVISFSVLLMHPFNHTFITPPGHCSFPVYFNNSFMPRASHTEMKRSRHLQQNLHHTLSWSVILLPCRHR